MLPNTIILAVEKTKKLCQNNRHYHVMERKMEFHQMGQQFMHYFEEIFGPDDEKQLCHLIQIVNFIDVRRNIVNVILAAFMWKKVDVYQMNSPTFQTSMTDLLFMYQSSYVACDVINHLITICNLFYPFMFTSQPTKQKIREYALMSIYPLTTKEHWMIVQLALYLMMPDKQETKWENIEMTEKVILPNLFPIVNFQNTLAMGSLCTHRSRTLITLYGRPEENEAFVRSKILPFCTLIHDNIQFIQDYKNYSDLNAQISQSKHFVVVSLYQSYHYTQVIEMMPFCAYKYHIHVRLSEQGHDSFFRKTKVQSEVDVSLNTFPHWIFTQCDETFRELLGYLQCSEFNNKYCLQVLPQGVSKLTRYDDQVFGKMLIKFLPHFSMSSVANLFSLYGLMWREEHSLDVYSCRVVVKETHDLYHVTESAQHSYWTLTQDDSLSWYPMCLAAGLCRFQVERVEDQERKRMPITAFQWNIEKEQVNNYLILVQHDDPCFDYLYTHAREKKEHLKSLFEDSLTQSQGVFGLYSNFMLSSCTPDWYTKMFVMAKDIVRRIPGSRYCFIFDSSSSSVESPRFVGLRVFTKYANMSSVGHFIPFYRSDLLSILKKHFVPTPHFQTFSDEMTAKNFVMENGLTYVLDKEGVFVKLKS